MSVGLADGKSQSGIVDESTPISSRENCRTKNASPWKSIAHRRRLC